MELSVTLFGLPPEQYVPLAVRADELGYEAVWLGDHLVTPVRFEPNYPYVPGGGKGRPYDPSVPIVDTFVALGHIAAVTRSVALGVGVLILPLREPIAVARAAATVQLLSGDRLLLGVGTGWMPEEFAAAGAEFAGRGARTDEMLVILRKLWTGTPVSHDGKSYRFDELQLAPPVTPIPIVVGGATPAALRRTARAGDGWFGPPACPLDETLGHVAEIERLRRDAGRADEPFRTWVRLVDPLDRATVERYRERGVERLVVGLNTLVPRDASLAGKLAAFDEAADVVLGGG